VRSVLARNVFVVPVLAALAVVWPAGAAGSATYTHHNVGITSLERATGSGGNADLADALLTVEDLPAGWSTYQPQPGDTGLRHVGLCGLPFHRPLPTQSSQSVAYALSNARGPVFGERIALCSKKNAKEVLAKFRRLPYPCHWRDVGINWSEETIPRLRLGDDDFAYLQRKSGNLPYSYEYLVRRGRVILFFVLSSEQPERSFAEGLVGTAVRRYDRGQVA
jgi:hypothetical protein